MGSFEGHVLPGIGFILIGLWHLFNHTKLHFLQPNSSVPSPWFPTPKIRYLELFFILMGSFISVSMELVFGPAKHHPFDIDGTIPSNHLKNFEHALISIFLFVYASLAILLDRSEAPARNSIAQLVAALVFVQEFFLFHVHSTDHHGLEGQYHLFLQYIVLVSLTTTLLGLGLPNSFLVCFVRSASILFQGVWFVVTGYMLWTPEVIPKGCFINNENKHYIVRCSNHDALSRAKALVNIEFSFYFIGITIFAILFYMKMFEIYGKSKGVVYIELPEELEELHGEYRDIESQKEGKFNVKRINNLMSVASYEELKNKLLPA